MIQDNTGTLEFIRAALQESDNLGLKEKMKLVRNTFLTHREMGQSEALYRIIPSMHLSDSLMGYQLLGGNVHLDIKSHTVYIIIKYKTSQFIAG